MKRQPYTPPRSKKYRKEWQVRMLLREFKSGKKPEVELLDGSFLYLVRELVMAKASNDYPRWCQTVVLLNPPEHDLSTTPTIPTPQP